MQQQRQNKSQYSPKLDHLGMFAFLWAIALLWHYLRRPADYSEFYLLFIPAVLVLARPKNALFIVLMALGYIYIFIYELPFSAIPNHPTLQMLMNFSIVASAGWLILKNYVANRTFSLDREEFFDLIRPLTIMAINIVYLMAVFNKLNTAFFDPRYSDVTRLLNFYYEAEHLLFYPRFNAKSNMVFIFWYFRYPYY